MDTQNASPGFSGDFALTVPQARSLRLRGAFRQEGQAWQATDILGSYADKTVTGSLACGEGKTPCSGTLAFGELYLEDVRKMAGMLLAPSRLPLRQGQLDVKAERLIAAPDMVVSSFESGISASNTQVAVKHYKGMLAGGELKGQLALHADGDVSRFHTVFDASAMDVGALWSEHAGAVSGKVSIKGALNGSFDAHAAVQGLEGYGTLGYVRLELADSDPAAGFATLEALRAMKPPFDAERVTPLLQQKLDGSRMTFEAGEAAFTVQNGKISLPLLGLKGSSGSVRFSGQLDPGTGLVQAEARFVPQILPEAQFLARYKGGWRRPERTLVSDDLAQLAMLRVLEEGSAVREERGEDLHEEGRLQRELQHSERMRRRAVTP